LPKGEYKWQRKRKLQRRKQPRRKKAKRDNIAAVQRKEGFTFIVKPSFFMRAAKKNFKVLRCNYPPFSYTALSERQ